MATILHETHFFMTDVTRTCKALDKLRLKTGNFWHNQYLGGIRRKCTILSLAQEKTNPRGLKQAMSSTKAAMVSIQTDKVGRKEG